MQLRAKLQLKADQQRAGIIDPMAKHRGIYLEHHVDDYKQHLVTSGCGADHIDETILLIARVCKACRFWEIDDITAPPLNSYLAGVIRKGKSYRTRNKALEHMKALVHWLQANDRMEADPFRSNQSPQ